MLQPPGVVLYSQKVPRKTSALVLVGASVVIYIKVTLVPPIKVFLAENLFNWLPEWLFLKERTHRNKPASSRQRSGTIDALDGRSGNVKRARYHKQLMREETLTADASGSLRMSSLEGNRI